MSGEMDISPVHLLTVELDRACRPTLNEPNLALNLEICDYVNAKQGSTPREAAIAVAKLILQRDPQTSELAVALLDNLVKNCGYPFQLQILRKEFLNELVKRFPERPPPRYTRLHRLILAQIEEWNQTICRTSKYKDDFGYIRDMRRLLLQKGYVFPEVKLEDASVLNPTDGLKSLEELQKEEAVVHSAKLQELIRRGKPQDLQEANKLMKIMAGFKDDHERENRKQIVDDVARLTRKVEILNEMLTSLEASGVSQIHEQDNEAVVDLYSSIKSSQPKITKIIEEGGGEDENNVNDLLALNDNINQLLNKYQLMKAGDSEQASKIHVHSSGAQGGQQLLNLIDFDDDEPISNDVKDQSGYNDLLSDLSNLAFTTENTTNTPSQLIANLFGAGGSILLGNNVNTSIQQPQPLTNAPTAGSADTGAGAGASDFDFLSGLNSPSPQLQSNTNTANAQLDPFGFNFPSATPNQIQNTSTSSIKTISIGQTDILKTEVVLSLMSPEHLAGIVKFTNLQSQPLNKFKFLMAVPKLCKLNLKPQLSDTLYGFGGQNITQEFSIDNTSKKQVKIKWKVEYTLGGQHKEDTGVSVLE